MSQWCTWLPTNFATDIADTFIKVNQSLAQPFPTIFRTIQRRLFFESRTYICICTFLHCFKTTTFFKNSFDAFAP